MAAQPVEAEAVELEGVGRRRAVEADLLAHQLGHRRLLGVGVAHDRQDRHDHRERVGVPPGARRAFLQCRAGHLVEVARASGAGARARRRPPRRPCVHIHGLTAATSIGGSGTVERAGRPRRRHERERPVVAFEGQLLVAVEGAEDGPHRQHVLLQAGSRAVERRRVAALDVGAHLRAEAEAEAAAAHVGQLPRRLRRHHRAAGEGDGHAGRQVEPGRGQRRRRDRQVRGAAGLGEDEAGGAGRLRGVGEALDGVEVAASHHDVEMHGGPPRWAAERAGGWGYWAVWAPRTRPPGSAPVCSPSSNVTVPRLIVAR